jgi:hypothetical protein
MKVQPDSRFGRLVVLRKDIARSLPYKISRWFCRCDCGSEVSIMSNSLRSGRTNSCGCIRSETTTRLKTKHGKRKTPEFDVWCNMRRRCYDPSNKSYRDYGGRGIKVCPQWRDSFKTFIEDVGPRPTASHQLDRINNFGNYEPKNVRWATRKEQCNNRRSNSRYEFRGQKLTISELMSFSNSTLSYAHIMQRIRKRGWPIEEAISIPLGSGRRTDSSRL